MSVRMSAARRAAVLKALRATGNQALAAECAKVSRRWICLHRKIDPEFRRDSDAAIAEAKAGFDRLRAEGATGPPLGWGYLNGEELVVRGSNARRLQIARARLHQWTPRVEAHFLAVLEATCNVRAACAAVGMSVVSANKHRHRWPGFARRWEEAVVVGQGVVESGLAAGAIALLDPEVPPFEPPVVAPMTVDDAIRLVRVYERRAREADRAWYRERRAREPARGKRGQSL
jgi:hypothetical protein